MSDSTLIPLLDDSEDLLGSLSLESPNQWLDKSQEQVLKALCSVGLSSEYRQSFARNTLIYPRLILYTLVHTKSCPRDTRRIDDLSTALVIWSGYDRIRCLVNFRSMGDFLWSLLDHCEPCDRRHQCNDRQRVEKLINLDVVGILARVLCILQIPKQKEFLLSRRGSEAHLLLDLFQGLMDCTGIPINILSPILRIMVKLSARSTVVPESLTLSGIEVRNRSVVDEGSFGDVHFGRVGRHSVAIKIMKVQIKSVANILKMFSKEAALWGQLCHPNILPFYGVYYWNDRVCLVSPWMSNGNLSRYLKHEQNADRGALVLDVARGLDYLHSNNIVHGDLKASNVLITPSLRACIADFGLSVVVNNPEFSFTTGTSTAVHGTVRRLAPELLSHESDIPAPLTYATDIYAFACMCYEVFVGKRPFFDLRLDPQVIAAVQSGQRPRQPSPKECVALKLDDAMWNLITCCWQRDPAKRLAAREIVRKLSSQNTLSDGVPLLNDWSAASMSRFPGMPRSSPFYGQASNNSLLAPSSLESTAFGMFQTTVLNLFLAPTLPPAIVALFPDQLAAPTQSSETYSQSSQRFVRVNCEEIADVALAQSGNKLVIKRLDGIVPKLSSQTTNFTPEGPENLSYVFDAISHFNFYLGLRNRKNPIPDGLIRMELYLLTGPQGFRKRDDSFENFIIKEGVLSAEERANYGMIGTATLTQKANTEPKKYGVAILNYSCHDLYPYLFYFDPLQYSIQSWYMSRCKGENAPLPACAPHDPKPTCVTVGYGVGGGLSYEFSVPEGLPSDTGFLKLFVSTTFVNLEWIAQPSPFDSDLWRRARAETLDPGIWDGMVAAVTVVR